MYTVLSYPNNLLHIVHGPVLLTAVASFGKEEEAALRLTILSFPARGMYAQAGL